MPIIVDRAQSHAIALKATLAAGLRRKFRDVIPDPLNDPAPWFSDVLQCQLYPKQLEMVLAVRGHSQVSTVGCNSSGKDFAAARIALWWMKAHNYAKVVITGPSYRQVNDVVWREVRSAYLDTPRDLGGVLYETTLHRWDDHRFIIGFSTDKPYKLHGFHCMTPDHEVLT